ncbi:tRNA (guanosine(46)-N7)-methyltransferase TrmB [Oscillospiraceae bacterium OttesenSCG-928-G22]|nr:tRNA (guanosine(46)-N7)-methyltransferase TrmB [Oscillospiraceae bacterium OttesenSCG-928-G22]
MRMRKKKNLERRLFAVRDYLPESPASYRGRWRTAFGEFRELHLEIGCGKGKFVTEMAADRPDTLFLALEKISDVLVMALERAAALELPNVRFLLGDAETIPDLFAAREVDRLYINFCDPWPARRHEGRRLTSDRFLALYREILSERADIWFKTDNRDLFEYSVTSFENNGFALSDVTRDLHGEGRYGGAMTEYETKFMAAGVPINRLVARILPRGAL